MKYYVTADVHGFYTEFQSALAQAGYNTDEEPHKLIILGDLFDRGKEAKEMQTFVLDKLEKDELILIRGNHEDLFEELVTTDQGLPYQHHVQNGTYDTVLQLTDYNPIMAQIRNYDFADYGKATPFYKTILPAMRNYYETGHYVFVHGWIPGSVDRNGYSYYHDWRNADAEEWKKARWYNGMDAANTTLEEKTIVCGHWHTSYGHSKYEKRGTEFGSDADFSPYWGSRIIALDACTAYSHHVNCIVLEDEEISGQSVSETRS